MNNYKVLLIGAGRRVSLVQRFIEHGFEYELHYTKFHLFFFVGRLVEHLSKAIGMEHKRVNSAIKWAGHLGIVQWKK